jgi:hypothetical protein
MKTFLALLFFALILAAGVAGVTKGFSDFSIGSISRILLVVGAAVALGFALFPKVKVHFEERPLLAWPALGVVYALVSPPLNVLAGLKTWDESASMLGGRVILFFVVFLVIGVFQSRKARSTQSG